MLWLMESPYTILLTGAFFASLCIFAWFQNPRREILMGLLGILVVTAALFGLERWWVTDGEAIQATIYQIARDVESNDVNRMLPHFHPSARDIAEQARNEVGNYQFESISVKSNFEIELEPNHQPPKALVGFNAVAVLSVASEGMKNSTIPRYIQFAMYKDSADGKWKIAGYAHKSAIPGQSSAYDVEMKMGQ
jgi:hypothetical protein